MEKRLIFALALSIVIIAAFQYFTAKPPLSPVITPSQVAAVTPTKAEERASIASPQPERPTISEETIVVQTPIYNITFSNIGGAIKEICLRDFKEKGSQDCLVLASIKDPADYILNIESSEIPNLNLAGYSVERSEGIISYRISSAGWDITKRYVLHNTKRGIELQLFIANRTAQARQFGFSVIGGAALSEAAAQDKRFVETTASIDGKIVGYKAPKNGRITNMGLVKWAAIKNKYFSLILKPMEQTAGQFYYQNSDGSLVMGLESDIFTVQPGALVERRFALYAGPSQISALKEFGHGAEETVSYGFFGGISKVLIAVLGFFYSIVHSWGLAIILLAIFLNVILFPLTQKSFRSMQKMQALHPQMEKLKKLHKDNPQKLNKEIMELYKQYKINPLSGCLPMLLQMPIFIALYQALIKSVELRNTKFLWIQDLSSPDAVKLPFTLPIIGNSINILPLIMVAAMVMQQKMSSKSTGGAVTDEQKQQQKMMMIMMPILFGFIFYSMPSGLVLYWVVNTALTIAEQAAIMKHAVIEE